MWEILEHRRTARQLKKLPLEILKRYEKWKDIVSVSGPAGLRMIRGFNEEPLGGEWNGHRSSRLNEQYRVIYRVERNQVRVEVVSVTAHDYRRK
ncbi:MAG: type II toxin-antitoxin system mRNA interferase toxin, RelE/StbE family [Gammaproteobacteria bacterium]|jgi:addiction module RelE/StbE family toxin|nr:type II toxin-antitoxin system mRNA interferase toxin, RelE/StbE family [Gammaproteobacteria bacterium]